MSCFRKHCLTFSGANSYSLNLFLFLIAKNFFNQRLFLLILFIFAFHFVQRSKRFRHFKKGDIACVLGLCLLHVVGTVASVICLSLKGCSFNWARGWQKTTKWLVHPVKTLISLGIGPVWSVFAECSKGSLGIWAFSRRTAKTLIRLSRCTGWSESSLAAKIILLVLLCGGSIIFKYSCKE